MARIFVCVAFAIVAADGVYFCTTSAVTILLSSTQVIALFKSACVAIAAIFVRVIKVFVYAAAVVIKAVVFAFAAAVVVVVFHKFLPLALYYML